MNTGTLTGSAGILPAHRTRRVRSSADALGRIVVGLVLIWGSTGVSPVSGSLTGLGGSSASRSRVSQSEAEPVARSGAKNRCSGQAETKRESVPDVHPDHNDAPPGRRNYLALSSTGIATVLESVTILGKWRAPLDAVYEFRRNDTYTMTMTYKKVRLSESGSYTLSGSALTLTKRVSTRLYPNGRKVTDKGEDLRVTVQISKSSMIMIAADGRRDVLSRIHK